MTKVTAFLLIILSFGIGVFTQKIKNVEKSKYFEESGTKKVIKINNLRGLLAKERGKMKGCVLDYNNLIEETNVEISELKNIAISYEERLNNLESNGYEGIQNDNDEELNL